MASNVSKYTKLAENDDSLSLLFHTFACIVQRLHHKYKCHDNEKLTCALLFSTALCASAIDTTKRVVIKGNQMTVPGELIETVGLADATKGDESLPGMVLQVFKK